MKPNISLIASCGLYCGECRLFKKGTCAGCRQNHKATWCGIRKCAAEQGYQSCAECQTFANPMDCKKFNNVMSKLFSFVFRSDRAACIAMIRGKGYEGYADYMVQNGLQTIKR